MRGPLLAARRARPAVERAAARAAIAHHLTAALAGRSCVAAFLPLPTEPLDPALLSRLAGRLRLLIPVVTGPHPLDWCEYTVATRPGELGIEEPDGPRLGPDAIGDAEVVLVPALAVAADGYRLGRGGGHYDRTLALRARLRGQPAPGPAADPETPRPVADPEMDRPAAEPAAVPARRAGRVDRAGPRRRVRAVRAARRARPAGHRGRHPRPRADPAPRLTRAGSAGPDAGRPGPAGICAGHRFGRIIESGTRRC